jgi:hypothetical protein
MPSQRTLDDVTMGELVDLEAAKPKLFDDPDRLARRLGLGQGDVPELTGSLGAVREAIAAIKRVIRPFRR